jgi:hypothetical protein
MLNPRPGSEMQQDCTLISELLAICEMKEVILTKGELTAHTGVSSSITKEEKQRIRRERDREARNLSKRIQLLREKLSMSEEQPEPLLSLTQLRKRAEDLNQYLVHQLQSKMSIMTPVW